MESLGDVFGELFVRRDATRTAASLRRHLADEGTILDGHKQLAAAVSPKEPAPAGATNAVVTNQATADSVRIHSILSPNGENFEVADNRVKAKNYADYTKRMTYLYLYAHECSGRTSVLDTDLRAFLKSAKAMDTSGNATRWLAKHIGYAKDGEDRVKLIVKGREEAKKTLNDALDPNVTDTWNPDSHQPRKRGKNKK